MDKIHRFVLCCIIAVLAISSANAQSPIKGKIADSAVIKKMAISTAKQAEQRTKTIVKQTNPFQKLSTVKKGANKFQLSNIAVESGLQTNRFTQPTNSTIRTSYGISANLSLFKIPLTLQFGSNQFDTDFSNPFTGGLFKAGFNRSAFQKQLVPELDRYASFKDELLDGKSASSHLREQLMTKTRTMAASKSGNYGELLNHFNQYGNIEQLLKMDKKTLTKTLDSLAISQKAETINLAQNKVENKKDSLSLASRSTVDSLANQILKFKEELKAYGIDPANLTAIEKYANQTGEDKLEAYVGQKMSSKSQTRNIQQFFYRLQDFNTGSFGDQVPGSFTNRDLFLKGFNFSLNTTKGPIKVGFASNKDIGLSKDAGFTQSNFNIPKVLSYVSIPTNRNSFTKGSLSWTGSFEKQSYRLNESSNLVPRTGSAFTLSQQLGLQKAGKVTVELSKSSAGFSNVGMIGSEQLLLEKNTFGNYFKDNLFETMSIGFKHDLDLKESAVKTNLFFSYSGIGFQNPAQQSMGNMGFRMGGTIRKGLFKNKVLLNFRGDLKNTPTSAGGDAHWQNHNINVETKFRFFKKFNFAVKYLDNGVSKVQEQSQSIYGAKKIQVEGSGSYKLFKQQGFTNLSVALQDMSNPISLLNSRFLTTVYSQTIVLKEVAFLGSVFYNKEIGKSSLLGNMFNGDVSCQYKIFENVSASSSITYLNNTNIAQQYGIRQSAQFTVKKNLDINIYGDLKKNVIAPLYPELFAAGRGEVSLRYYFK